MVGNINGQIEGVERVTSLFNSLASATRTFRPAFKDIRNDVVAPFNQRQFETEGGLSGGWKPLDQHYAEQKAKKYPGKGILRKKDRLFKSLTNVRSPNFLFETTSATMAWGSKIPYAIYHQNPSRWGRPPRRKIIVITEPFELAVLGKLREYIFEKAQQRVANLAEKRAA